MVSGHLWLAATLALGQAPAEGRSAMSVPAARVFEGMLRFALAGETDKLRRSVELIGPVLREHEERFGEPAVEGLLARLVSPEPSVAAAGVEELVVRDVAVLLGAIPEAPENRARSLVRAAMLEWRLVEERILDRDLRAAQSVSARLRDLRLLVDDGAGGVAALVTSLDGELLALTSPEG